MSANRVLFVAFMVNLSCVIIVISKNAALPCTTPDNESAHCVSLFACPGLMKSLSTLEPTAINYVKQSICLGCKAGSFMVCCGQANLVNPILLPPPNVTPAVKLADPTPSITTPSTTTTFPKNESKRDRVLRTLLPDRRYCGFQHTDDRFYNETATALDEFPWLVHIKFTDIYTEYKVGDRCTGVLINNKYVLTDTMCANPAIKVRLGQYDAIHKMTCIENPQAHECNEGTIEIRVNKKINLHPDVLDNYALTLIRLEKGVDYTDFVRPICLPLRESYRRDSKAPLTFSGWGGKPGTTILEDAIKKRTVYDSAPMNTCLKTMNEYARNLILQLTVPLNCYTPKEDSRDFACRNDHGGPLMYSDKRKQWYVESVVVDVVEPQFGECTKENSVLAIKINQEIIEKILDNIEP